MTPDLITLQRQLYALFALRPEAALMDGTDIARLAARMWAQQRAAAATHMPAPAAAAAGEAFKEQETENEKKELPPHPLEEEKEKEKEKEKAPSPNRLITHASNGDEASGEDLDTTLLPDDTWCPPANFLHWTADDFRRVAINNRGYLPNDEALEDFILYWTETDEQGNMNFQTRKHFSMQRRMTTWVRKSAEIRREQDKRYEGRYGIIPEVKAFEPPTEDDVSQFAAEAGINAQTARAAYLHYAAVAWMKGNRRIADWQAAIRAWALRDDTSADQRRSNNPSKLSTQTAQNLTNNDSPSKFLAPEARSTNPATGTATDAPASAMDLIIRSLHNDDSPILGRAALDGPSIVGTTVALKTVPAAKHHG